MEKMENKIELALKRAVAENKVKELDLLKEKKFSKQCQIKSNPRLFMMNGTEYQAGEEIRKLTAYIFERLPLPEKNTILVASPTKGDGKTSIAVNLGIAISQHYVEHALLVELDLRKLGFEEFFDFPNGCKGLSNYLEGEISDLPDIFYRAQETNKLTIIPGGKRIKNSTEAVHSPKMRSFFENIKRRYDDRYIIIDSPPIINAAEPKLLSSLVDAVILVVDIESTPREAIEEALSSLGKEKIVGVILNKVKDSSMGYYSGYYSYYG